MDILTLEFDCRYQTSPDFVWISNTFCLSGKAVDNFTSPMSPLVTEFTGVGAWKKTTQPKSNCYSYTHAPLAWISK